MSKFKSKRTIIDNINFDSKLEAAYYSHLKILQRIGEVKFWLLQVPFLIPGGKKYLCDFLVFYTDGSYKFIDVKGIETQLFKLKKSIIEELYCIKINIIKKGDF